MRLTMLILIAITLAGCNLGTPTETDTETTLSATETSPIDIADQQAILFYWRSFGINEVTPTEDDYVFIEQIVLRRQELETAPSNDVSADLQSALGAMLSVPNLWQADNVSIDSLTVTADLVTVNMSGEIRAVGGAVLSIVPTQFLLTIFEQVTINRAIVTLNGEHLGNISASHDSQIRPADFVVTRDGFFEGLQG